MFKRIFLCLLKTVTSEEQKIDGSTVDSSLLSRTYMFSVSKLYEFCQCAASRMWKPRRTVTPVSILGQAVPIQSTLIHHPSRADIGLISISAKISVYIGSENIVLRHPKYCVKNCCINWLENLYLQAPSLSLWSLHGLPMSV